MQQQQQQMYFLFQFAASIQLKHNQKQTETSNMIHKKIKKESSTRYVFVIRLNQHIISIKFFNTNLKEEIL